MLFTPSDGDSSVSKGVRLSVGVLTLSPPEAYRPSCRPATMISALVVAPQQSMRSLLWAAALAGAPRHRPPRCEEELPSFEIRLPKPLGIAFEEGDTSGLVVERVLEGGSAFEDGQIWPGDLLLEVNGVDVSRASFDAAMGLLTEADGSCTLLVGRARGKVAALRGPNGRLEFSAPGRLVRESSDKLGIACEFECMRGSCGACEMFLKDWETEELKPVRLCMTKFPKGARASLMPYEVLSPDSEEAQQFNEDMRKKFGTKTQS